jgi:hypothetical protein
MREEVRGRERVRKGSAEGAAHLVVRHPWNLCSPFLFLSLLLDLLHFSRCVEFLDEKASPPEPLLVDNGTSYSPSAKPHPVPG